MVLSEGSPSGQTNVHVILVELSYLTTLPYSRLGKASTVDTNQIHDIATKIRFVDLGRSG